MQRLRRSAEYLEAGAAGLKAAVAAGDVVLVDREQVREVIASALNETRELFSSLHIPSDRMRFKRLSESARSAIGAAAFETGEWAAVTASAAWTSWRTASSE